MLYSSLGNENNDAGHIKCSRGTQVLHPDLWCRWKADKDRETPGQPNALIEAFRFPNRHSSPACLLTPLILRGNKFFCGIYFTSITLDEKEVMFKLVVIKA